MPICGFAHTHIHTPAWISIGLTQQEGCAITVIVIIVNMDTIMKFKCQRKFLNQVYPINNQKEAFKIGVIVTKIEKVWRER